MPFSSPSCGRVCHSHAGSASTEQTEKTQRDIECIALGSIERGGQGPSLLEPYGSCSISESISASVPVSSSVSLMLSTAPSVMVTLLVA